MASILDDVTATEVSSTLLFTSTMIDLTQRMIRAPMGIPWLVLRRLMQSNDSDGEAAAAYFAEFMIILGDTIARSSTDSGFNITPTKIWNQRMVSILFHKASMRLLCGQAVGQRSTAGSTAGSD